MGTLRLFGDVFASPARGLAAAAERKSILPPILAATAVSLLLAAVLVPRMDYASAVQAALDKAGGTLTPHDLEEKLASANKLGAVATYAGGVVGSAVLAVVTAFLLWIGLRTAGARPAFLPSLAVSAWGLLPSAAGKLLMIPALLGHERLDPRTVAGIPAWTAAHWMPTSAPAPLQALGSSLNLFSLWSAVLLTIGLAGVAQVTRARSGAVVGVLWALATALQMAAANAAG